MTSGFTPLDEDEAADLRLPLLFRADLDFWEQQGVEKARRWAARSRMMKRELVTISGLRRLHAEMFNDVWRWAGQFRFTEKNIGVPPYRIGSDLKGLCDDTALWISESIYPPFELVTRFHHRLVLIHPFPNGNGRWARLATDQLCLNERWNLPEWGMQIPDDSRRREAYLAALRRADAHEMSSLTEFLYPEV